MYAPMGKHTAPRVCLSIFVLGVLIKQPLSVVNSHFGVQPSISTDGDYEVLELLLQLFPRWYLPACLPAYLLTYSNTYLPTYLFGYTLFPPNQPIFRDKYSVRTRAVYVECDCFTTENGCLIKMHLAFQKSSCLLGGAGTCLQHVDFT